MKYLILLLFPLLSRAEYFFGYGTGAFLGRHQLHGEWVSENKKHHALGIFGFTQDEEIGEIRQLSGAYLWSLDPREHENFGWTPLLAGGFFTYSDNKNFYFSSPSKYKNPAYYDTTNFRFGFRFGSELILVKKNQKTIRLSVDGSLIEQALLIYFNNPKEFTPFETFWSLGFSIRFDY